MARSAIPAALDCLRAAKPARSYSTGGYPSWTARVEPRGSKPAAWSLSGGIGSTGNAHVSVVIENDRIGIVFITGSNDGAVFVGKGAASHVNSFLSGTGLTVAAAQYRHEARGPVVWVRDPATNRKVCTVFLTEVLRNRNGIAAFSYHIPTGQWVGLPESTLGTAYTDTFAPFTQNAPVAPTPTIPGSTVPPGTAAAPTPAAQPQPAPAAPAPAPTKVTAAPALAKPTTAKTALSANIPKDYVVLKDRHGGDLVLPRRTVETFHAAVQSRFEGQRPAHPIAIGPTGTAKTEGLLALAASEGLTLAGIVQCGGIVEVSDLYGQTQPDETAANGWRRFPSALWRAVSTAIANPDDRFVVLLDEVNRMANATAQNALLGFFDGTASLANPATGEAINLPSNLMAVATANIGAAYGGTVRMDAALQSRWWTNIVFGYLPEAVEAALFEHVGLDTAQARLLARAAAELRKSDSVDPLRSSLVPGTRELVAVAVQAQYDPQGVAGAWHDKVTCSFSNEGRDPGRTEYARVRVVAELVFKGTQP